MTFTKWIALCCLIMTSALLAQEDKTAVALSGYWEGAAMRNGTIQVFSLELESRDGHWFGRMSVAETGSYSSPLRDTLQFADGWLSFGSRYGATKLWLDKAAAELRGEAVNRDSVKTRIQLKRRLAPVTPAFVEENLTYMAGETHMAGMLLRPAWGDKHPAIVIVQGRSYGSRWGQYGEARRLAEHGIAAFIFDGRERGESQGDRATATAEDRFADVIGAVELLRSRKDVDPGQIGLWGISAGGWVISEVARRVDNIAFLILDVGPAESLADQQGHVCEYRMRWFAEEGFSETDFQEAFAYQKKLVEMSWQDATWKDFQPLVAAARKKPWAGYVDMPESIDNSELDYFRRRKGFDPVPALKQIKMPVLAIYGERDFVVPGRVNADKLKKYLSEAGNDDYKIVVFPEADHGMNIPSRLPEAQQWPQSVYRWRRMAPGVYETIYGWLKEHVQVAQPGE